VTLQRHARQRVFAGGKTAIAVVIAVGLLFPIIWTVFASFRTTSEFYAPVQTLLPQHWTLANYAQVVNQLGPLTTSVVVALLAAVVAVVFAVPAAYALAAFEWRIKGLALFIILVTQIVPTVMLATPLYLTFSKMGLLNSIPGLVIADASAGLPFAILVLTAFMGDFPKELREAAFIDGAGEWRTLWSVVLPPSRAALISAALFSFLFAWGDFLWAVTLNTNGNVVPLTLSIFQFVGNHQANWGAIMATGVIAIIPGLILLVVAQRYVSAGLTAGAIKD
jgi:multiple sugar transport system permease protein